MIDSTHSRARVSLSRQFIIIGGSATGLNLVHYVPSVRHARSYITPSTDVSSYVRKIYFKNGKLYEIQNDTRDFNSKPFRVTDKL